jgi:hypothetical protein
VGTGTGQAPAEQVQQAPPGGEATLPEWARSELGRARREAAEARTTAAALRQQVTEFTEGQQSDTEKLTNRVAQAESRAKDAEKLLREERLSFAVQLEALAQGFHRADEAFALVDREKLTVPDDAGIDWKPPKDSVKEAVALLASARPHLLKANQPDHQTSPGAPARQGRKLTKEDVEAMTEEQVNSLLDTEDGRAEYASAMGQEPTSTRR